MRKALISMAVGAFSMLASTAGAEQRVVSWNASPAFYEGLVERINDFAQLEADLSPDVLILVEIGGKLEAQLIAEALGWETYYLAVSDWAVARTSAFQALESAVISKIPIERVVEYDASPDGAHTVVRNGIDTSVPVSEVALTSNGIPHFGETLGRHDRGTLRVDLENGLSIFPVHLKSNRNSACFDMSDAAKALPKYGFLISQNAQNAYQTGFAGATNDHLKNARKRERVIASVARVAQEAIDTGRVAMISGDFNTAFEPGKFGREVADCTLQDFSCAKAPFPASACSNGDGFDDTLSILELGLTGSDIWTFLSRDMDRTYTDKAYSDLAIDHIAVPSEVAARFTTATKSNATYGSDHYPLVTIFHENE